LQVLNHGANSLTGGMPATHGSLSNLVTLDPSSNFLEGPIQEKSLEKLFELKELHLSWLKTQSSVKVLTMSNSGISDLAPCWFWNWTLQIEFS